MSDIPRRIRVDLQTPAEKAIREAMRAVEEAGASEALTKAVTLLGDALGSVADHVDANGRRPDWHAPNDPPFDGKMCPACPSQIRNLMAVAHNLSLRLMGKSMSSDTSVEDLWRAVEACRPISDAHFANPRHSHRGQ